MCPMLLCVPRAFIVTVVADIRCRSPIDRKRPAAGCRFHRNADFHFGSRIEDRGQAIAGAEFRFDADEIVVSKQGKVV
jgi:hypothetical protein